MSVNVFQGKVAKIDLGSGRIDYEKVRDDDARRFIGARGLGVKYVYDNGAGVEPFSAENILAFVVGPLTGTQAKMSGRWACVTKSPLTGTVADSHMGGWSGARLRWAGLDAMIVRGRSEKPVYLYVADGVVEICDAADLWGMTTAQTIVALQERHRSEAGKGDLSVVAIGPAGENLSRMAGWLDENTRSFGRGGAGAVAGFKRLKAIVIRGHFKNRVSPADPEAWELANKAALDSIRDENKATAPKKGALSVYGTNCLMNIINFLGALPARNSQACSSVHAATINGETVKEKYIVKDPTCHACPVACKKEAEIKEGPYTGTRMESVEFESVWALGANCDHGDAEAIIKMIDEANRYGLDTIELGQTLACYMELTERGLVPPGEGLSWGDAAAMVPLVRKIALREGTGDVLAEGTARTARHFGAPEVAMTVKGQAIPAYDPRGLKGMGLGYATSNRGACHLRGYTVASEVLGVGGKTEPLAWEGKGKLTRQLQDLLAFADSLDLCKFSSFAESPEIYAAQYAAFTGQPFTADDVLAAGERVYNLERHYNNLAGFREGSDTLPERFLKEPSTATNSEGHVCELDKMLEEYYAERGWKQGVVPEQKLQELGIL
ncbi:MAG: aldehyde ferredoxin oxidoreductase family protein [Thermoguttaceae bacterium]